MSTMSFAASRFRLWGMLAVASCVSLVAFTSATPKPRDHNEKYVIVCASFSLIFGVLYTAMAKWASTGHHDFLKKAETSVSFILFVLWCAAIAVINEVITIKSDEQLYVVTNANVYYFTWSCFFLTLAVLGTSLQDMSESDGTFKTARSAKWTVLAASCLIVMASCISIFRQFNCQGDRREFCVATKLGLSVGCCCAFTALVAIAVINKAGAVDPNKFIQIELIVAACTAILFAAAVALITKPNGPGSTIGNLYYSTWISFFVAASLMFECVGIALEGVKMPTLPTSQGAEKSEAPSEQAAPNAPDIET